MRDERVGIGDIRKRNGTKRKGNLQSRVPRLKLRPRHLPLPTNRTIHQRRLHIETIQRRQRPRRATVRTLWLILRRVDVLLRVALLHGRLLRLFLLLLVLRRVALRRLAVVRLLRLGHARFVGLKLVLLGGLDGVGDVVVGSLHVGWGACGCHFWGRELG